MPLVSACASETKVASVLKAAMMPLVVLSSLASSTASDTTFLPATYVSYR